MHLCQANNTSRQQGVPARNTQPIQVATWSLQARRHCFSDPSFVLYPRAMPASSLPRTKHFPGKISSLLLQAVVVVITLTMIRNVHHLACPSCLSKCIIKSQNFTNITPLFFLILMSKVKVRKNHEYQSTFRFLFCTSLSDSISTVPALYLL